MRRSVGFVVLASALSFGCGDDGAAAGSGTDTGSDTGPQTPDGTSDGKSLGSSGAAAGSTESDADGDTVADSSSSGTGEPPDLGPPPVCTIDLDCGGATIPDEPKIPCAIDIEDGVGGVEYSGWAGVEKRGRSSQMFPKPQYAVELRVSDQDETEVPTNLLDMGRESDWVLNGAYIDRALMRNKLLFELFQSFGGTERYAPETKFCTLTLDGDYRGIYLLSERIKRDDDRVVLPADRAMNGSSFLLKQDEDGGIRSVGIAYGSWRLMYPRQDTATPQQIAGVVAVLDSWDAVISGVDTTTDLFSILDLDSAVDFILLEELAKNHDAYFLSMHVWKAPGGQIHFTPWDLDLSIGQPNYNNSAPSDGWVTVRPALVEGMAQRAEFRERFGERWRELRDGVLSDDALFARLDFHLETIAEHVDANFERWPIEEVQFLGDSLYLVSSHDEEMALVRTWLEERLVWMDDNIDDYAN